VTAHRQHELLRLTADLVIAHVVHNDVNVEDLPALIASMHEGLARTGQDVAEAEPPVPAVPIRSSIRPDYLVCLEDGRKLKMLKRYLMARYGMTPADYRAKWGLPADYPMVAPNYAATRRALAEKTGLGRKPALAVQAAAEPTPTPAPAPEPVVAPPAVAETAPPRAGPAVAETRPKRKVLRPLFTPSRVESPAPAAALPDRDAVPDTPLAILCQAIIHRLCVMTTYNKRGVLLAPHIIFTRHDEPYLRAVTIELDGKRPREAKLGTFKLTGLGPITTTARTFNRFADFNPDDADYAGKTVCVLS
jgi:predicted transcriptional regulator